MWCNIINYTVLIGMIMQRILPPLRSTVLREAILNPRLCYEMTHNDYQIKKTDSMVFGTLAHLAMLQPDVFENSYVIKEPNKGRDLDQNADNKYMLLPKTYDHLRSMQQEAMRTKTLPELLKCGLIEREFRATLLGYECVARPDIVLPKNRILIDYKTTSTHKKRWEYVALDGGYDVQFAHYAKVLEANDIKIDHWYHIVQSTTDPFCEIVRYSYGRNFRMHAIARWTEAMKAYDTIAKGEFNLDTMREEVVEVRTYDNDKFDDIAEYSEAASA